MIGGKFISLQNLPSFEIDVIHSLSDVEEDDKFGEIGK